MSPLATTSLLAFHDGQGAGEGGGIAILLVFVGVLATTGWLIFSELRWRHTVSVTAAAWVAGIGLYFLF